MSVEYTEKQIEAARRIQHLWRQYIVYEFFHLSVYFIIKFVIPFRMYKYFVFIVI